MRQGFLALIFAASVYAAGGQPQQSSVPDAPAPQQNIPSAPAPQAPSASGDNSVSGLASQAAHGKASSTNNDQQQAAPPTPEPPAATGSTQANPDGPPQQDAPYIPKNAEEAANYTLHANVNAVEIPVTVLDQHHAEVPGLTFRDFRIYENGVRQHIDFFSVDPKPLAVAFVIDQSLPRDIMQKVNDSLSAITGAFTPQDEAAVFTYADGVTQQTTLTAATGDRLPAILARSKARGEEMGPPDTGGTPFSSGPTINDRPIDPNLAPQRSTNGFITLPREVHTLNDAILAAAEGLSKTPKSFRRVIYVISDGKESRSKAGTAEVIRYLQSHRESVYATAVGESAVPYLGYIDKFHLPLFPYDNILPRYTTNTGGEIDRELSTDGMERSFSRILDGARTQYTLGYYTHGSTLDSRYRRIEVHVEKPNLDVIAPPGYYPSASLSQQ